MPSRSPIGLTFWPITPFSSRSRTTTVKLLNGFMIRPARPRARGRNRFMTNAFAHRRLGHEQAVDVELVVVLGVGDRRLQRLPDVAGDPPLGEGRAPPSAALRVLATDQISAPGSASAG